EAPGGIGEFLSELGFGGSGRAVFIEKPAAVEQVGAGVFGRQHGGAAGEPVAGSVAGRAGFSFWSTRACGEPGIGAVSGCAVDGCVGHRGWSFRSGNNTDAGAG